MSVNGNHKKIGLLAGWGRFPVEVARALKRQGYGVHCQGIKGHASPDLARICDSFRYVGIARLGHQIRHFRRHGVCYATMAGKIFKAKLMYHRWGWLHHFPDWECCRTFYPHFITRTRDRNDDTLLTAVVDLFARHEIMFAPATDFAPELLVKPGRLSGTEPTAAQWKDIQFGWLLAKEMGRLDVGQTVVVKGQSTIAVEAVEGTDACIRRAGEICPQGGFTVVKVAKPRQDMRFDVPTIGPGTLQTIRQAGGRVLAVEAQKTIIVDQPVFVRFAQQHRISVVAVDAERWCEQDRAA